MKSSPTTPAPSPTNTTVPARGRDTYLPDGAKLLSAGFRLSRIYAEATSFVGLVGAEERVIVVYHIRRRIKLKDDDCQRMEFACPDEAFFDQLLIAIGWQPANG